MKILFTCAGRRTYLLKYFKENLLEGDKIVAKKALSLPKEVKNVIKCRNQRCITSIEQELDQIFVLTDEEREVYRCKYCEEKYTNQV